MARPRCSNSFGGSGSFNFLGHAQFCAARARISTLLFFSGFDRFRRDQFQIVFGITPRLRPFRAVEPFPAAIAKEIFDDAILKRMKCDNGDSRTRLESRSQDAQAACERAEFIIYLNAQRLEDLCSRMTPPMAPDDFFDRASERKRLPEGRFLALFHNQTRDASRGRFLPKIAKQTSQLFLAVFVDDALCGRLILRIHPHIERPISHNAETALRIFELPRRHAEIEKRAPDCRDPKLLENFVDMAKIHPPKADSSSEPGQSIGRVLNRLGILIQSQDVGASSQDGIAVAAATAGCIDNKSTRPRCE